MSNIILQPVDCHVNLGDLAEFTVNGGTGATYQWEKANDALSQFVPLAGKTNATLQIIPDSYTPYYSCKVTFPDSTSDYSDTVQVIQEHNSPTGIHGQLNGYYYTEGYTGLTQDEKKANCQKLMTFFTWSAHWSRNFTCAVLGNVWLECNMSPGTWEDFDNTARGYGWVQWTPCRQLFDWFANHYPLQPWRNDGLLQAKCLKWESENQGNPENVFSNYQWNTYKHSNEDVEVLAEQFCRSYLRPSPEEIEQSLQLRINRAVWISENIWPTPPIWLYKKITEEGRKNR